MHYSAVNAEQNLNSIGEIMKIITWNCNGKFSEKFPNILEENADIYMIQECKNPSIFDSSEYKDFRGLNFFDINSA